MAGAGLFAKAIEFFVRKGAARDGLDAAAHKAERRSLRDRLFGKAREDVPLPARTITRDPIDVASGEVILHRRDVELKGVLPLVLERTHISSYRSGGLYGPSWASTLDQHLEVGAGGVRYAAADGMILAYPPAAPGSRVFPLSGPRWPLTAQADGGYVVDDPRSLQRMHFGPGGPHRPLEAISDRNDNRIDFVHDATGTLRGIAHSGGHRIAVDTARGRITALRLITGDGPEEVLVRFGHDDAGNLTEAVDSSVTAQRFTYDAEHRLTGWRDRNGHWYRYTYDDAGRAVRGEGAGGALDTIVDYDPDGRWTRVTDSRGGVTTYRFDDERRVVAQVDPLGHATEFAWDAHDRLVSRTDPLGTTVRYVYDDAGNLRSLRRPDGLESHAEYDAFGLPTRVTEADGTVWRNERDERGNIIAVVDPLGNTTRYGYDEHGAVTSIVDPAGRATTIRVDAAGLPQTVTDPSGATTTYTFDPFGRVATITDPVGGTARFTWTPEGRPASRSLPGGGAPERWEYDPEGNVVAHTDASGRTTRFDYGPFSVPIARTGPDGSRLEFRHDTELRVESVVDQQGLTWRYSYDAAGRLVGETDFNGRVVDYGHDPAGRLISRAYAGEAPTTYVRDVMGNVVEKRAPDRVTTFEYDPAGRIVRATEPAADLRFDRDALGRVTAETCDGRTLTWAYDASGRRTRRRTPGGSVSTWEYDPAGRPSVLSSDGRRIVFEYDAAGREVRRRIGANVVLDQQWDARHRLVSQALWRAARPGGEYALTQHRTYTRGAADEVLAMADRIAGPRGFDLDPAGRITGVRAQGWTERYAYNAAGEIVDAGWPAGPDPGGAAATDAGATDAGATLGDREYRGTRLHRAGKTFYEHDDRGRVVLRRHRTLSGQDRSWRYEWDTDDRLVAVTTPDGARWCYRYDALGRRVAKLRVGSSGAVAEQVDFTWDGDRLVEQRHRAPARPDQMTSWEYAPGGYEPVAQTRRDAVADAPQEWIDREFHAIVTDAVGSVTELVDTAGNLAWYGGTALFGQRLANRPGPDGAGCPLRFAGHYHDAETGLHYNRHRYYEAGTGRYLSSDPIGLSGGIRTYGYVRNPLTQRDPLGLTQEVPPGMIRIFRTSGRAEENELYQRTGYVMSDAAQQGYHEGGSLDSAVARSQHAHDVNVSGIGSEDDYAWAHQGGANWALPAHTRSLVSFSTDEAGARRWALREGNALYAAVVDPSTLIWTTHGGTETEVLVRHMVRAERWM